jgi:hypothetical protein
MVEAAAPQQDDDSESYKQYQRALKAWREAQRKYAEATRERRKQEEQRDDDGVPTPPPPPSPPLAGQGPFRFLLIDQVRSAGRLGVHVDRLPEALADQLDLTADRGFIVVRVLPETPAARAGIKTHDILLEINGRPVPQSIEDLHTLVSQIKEDRTFDIVILRKGQKKTISGLKLPPVQSPQTRRLEWSGPGRLDQGFPIVSAFGPRPGDLRMLQQPGQHSVMTTVFRERGRFTVRHQEGTLVITLTGSVSDGKGKVNKIHVQDGKSEHEYESVDAVPERYRDKARHLAEMAEKEGGKIEVQVP